MTLDVIRGDREHGELSIKGHCLFLKLTCDIGTPHQRPLRASLCVLCGQRPFDPSKAHFTPSTILPFLTLSQSVLAYSYHLIILLSPILPIWSNSVYLFMSLHCIYIVYNSFPVFYTLYRLYIILSCQIMCIICQGCKGY